MEGLEEPVGGELGEGDQSGAGVDQLHRRFVQQPQVRATWKVAHSGLERSSLRIQVLQWSVSGHPDQGDPRNPDGEDLAHTEPL